MSKYLTANSKSSMATSNNKGGVQRNNFDIPANVHSEYGDVGGEYHENDPMASNSNINNRPTSVDNTEPLNLEVGNSRQRK